jgi:pyruvate formate lyase activating enzyme
MKGMVFDIRSFSVHDGPGIRLTVFLKGCPLNCFWCHNPESRSPEKQIVKRCQKVGEKNFEVEEVVGYEMHASEILERALADKTFFEESGGGITLSGGEPLMQVGFATEILQLCKQNNIHTALDTSGYASLEALNEINHYTDLFLFDIKLLDDNLHIRHTGKSNRNILKNLYWLLSQNERIILRLPLIPGITDSPANLSAIKELLENNKGFERLDLLPYHNLAEAKHARIGRVAPAIGTKAYTHEKAEEIKQFFMSSVPVISIGG